MADISGGMAFLHGVGNFCKMFVVSSLIGVSSGVFSAVVLKFMDLRKTPSLEVALMLIFSYIPYGLAEGLGLSGMQFTLKFLFLVLCHYPQQFDSYN